MSPPSCATCPHARPLMFAVYCAQHPELHNLPASIGHMATPPIIQATPPLWCPLQARPASVPEPYPTRAT